MPPHGQLARWIKWRACDVGEAKEGLGNELWCRWINGRAVKLVKQWKGWIMSCDVGEVTERLENELWRRWSDRKVGEWALLILQPFCHFTYVTTHSPTLLSLYLCRSSFSNPSVASPMSQFILQPFFCFPYVTSSSLNSPGKPPMSPPPLWDCLRINSNALGIYPTTEQPR